MFSHFSKLLPSFTMFYLAFPIKFLHGFTIEYYSKPLQHTEDVWTMFAAIATHKFVITFCVSLELLQV